MQLLYVALVGYLVVGWPHIGNSMHHHNHAGVAVGDIRVLRLMLRLVMVEWLVLWLVLRMILKLRLILWLRMIVILRLILQLRLML